MPDIARTNHGPEISAKLARLLELDFIFVGSWQISPGGIDFTLECYADEQNVLYAFAVDGDLVYIGR
jgi:hypothetical protein